MLKISIVIPIYRVEKYIGECLDSIIIQEHEGIDLECILINDCTPDKSVEVVVKKLQNYHGRINFIIKHHNVNRGQCAARNTGSEYATGDYILFVDSDDTLAPGALQYFHEELDKANSNEVDVIMGNSYGCMDKRELMTFDKETSFLIDNTYVFFIILRGIDLFENYVEADNLRKDLYTQRDRLLQEVKSLKYYFLYLFFLTSVKPFFYLTKLRIYRRNFDRLSKVFVSWTKCY